MAILMEWQPDTSAVVHVHDKQAHHLTTPVVGVTMSGPGGLSYGILGVQSSNGVGPTNR